VKANQRYLHTQLAIRGVSPRSPTLHDQPLFDSHHKCATPFMTEKASCVLSLSCPQYSVRVDTHLTYVCLV